MASTDPTWAATPMPQRSGSDDVAQGQAEARAGAPGAPAAETGSGGPATAPADPHLATSRLSTAWTATVAAVVLLVLVLVFILQNLQDVRVSYFGAHSRIPLGLDLLVAAVLGGLLVLLAGAARLLQMRLRARRALRAGD